MTSLNAVRLFSTTTLCMLILAGCGNKDIEDSEAASSAAEPNPLAEYVGDWMSEAYVGDAAEPANVALLKATENPETWSMKLPQLDEPIGANSVVVMGDTVVSTWGPFASGIREGLMAQEMTVSMKADGDRMSGRAKAVYSDGAIVNFRLESERIKNQE